VVRENFAPAAALLVACGRRSLEAPAGAAAKASLAEDWQALPDAADRHGMTAWVQASIADWPDAPEHVRDQMAQRARLQRMRALQAVSELSTVTSLLSGAGIETVSMKGPLFARWLYGDAGMRRFVDLDLLIDPAQRDRALQALGAAGYALPAGLSAAAARTVFAGTGAWPLAHATAIGIDLHWKLQAVGFGSPLPSGDLLRDSATTAVAGGAIRIPAPTHAAALALLHAAKHLWASLELTLAIAHLMRRADVDWPRVYELARRAGAWNGAAAGLALAARIFDVDLPRDLRDRIQPGAVRPLVDAALRFLAMPDVAGAPLREELAAHRAGLDGPGDRLRYAAWRLLAPTPLEAAWWPLPDHLTLLYAPLRLIRLLTVRRRDGGR